MAENNEHMSYIETLRARRDRLDAAIQALEALQSEDLMVPAAPTSTRAQSREIEIQHDTFVGMSVVDATVQYLKMVGRPARSLEEIHTNLNRGGLNSTPGTMQTLLSRSHNGNNPVVRRAGRGTWGLPEWYQPTKP